jgi:hypothetical protein
VGIYKKEKKRLISKLEGLDKKAETNTLRDSEINLIKTLFEGEISSSFVVGRNQMV